MDLISKDLITLCKQPTCLILGSLNFNDEVFICDIYFNVSMDPESAKWEVASYDIYYMA